MAIFGNLPLRAAVDSHVTDGSFGAPVLEAEHMARAGSVTVGFSGRPRWEDGSLATADRIASLYQREGSGFLSQLRASFALFVVDDAKGEALLAIDRMGIESLAFGANGHSFAFGTSPRKVANVLSGAPDINRQALFDFMLGHMVAAPSSVFAGVQKLLPATCLRVERSGRTSVERYWNPDFTRSRESIEELRRELLPTIERAVAATDPEPYEHTGAFLSGGLDSSTVAGVLTRASERKSPAFSVGFGVEEFDELGYARIASRHFQSVHHEYVVTPDDIVDLVPAIAAAYDEPFGNSSAVPVYCCARMARERGIAHLLAGDGGDELFGGNERYVRHKIFELYRRLPSWLRAAVTDPLAALVDPERAPLPLRKFSSYVRQAQVKLPERYETWNLIYREGPENVFEPQFLSSVDPAHPLRAMSTTWDECPSDDLLDRMLWYDWKYTLADNDLRKVTRMCELAGVRVSFPMIDEAVIDLSLRVPSERKIEGRELRSYYKDSMRGFLPIEIIKKKKHGFGLPFGLWLKNHGPLRELVFSSMASLKTRGIIRREFIDRVLDEHKDGHASYYGSAIWDLLMLEQWHQQHVDDRSASERAQEPVKRLLP